MLILSSTFAYISVNNIAFIYNGGASCFLIIQITNCVSSFGGEHIGRSLFIRFQL